MMHQPKLYKAAFGQKCATPLVKHALMKHAIEEMFIEIGRGAHAPLLSRSAPREAQCQKRCAIDTEQRA
jgi:hypothetical protein